MGDIGYILNEKNKYITEAYIINVLNKYVKT